MLFGVPIVFYAFFKSVYDFGPKHYRQRGLWEIITEPVPSNLESRERKRARLRTRTRVREFDCLILRQRPAPVKRKLLRRGWDNCARTPIIPLRERYCIYSSFYNSQAGLLGAGPMEASQEMTLTIHFEINVFSVPQIVFIPQPKNPPDGWITDVVMKCLVTMIFGVMMSNCLCRFYAAIWLRVVRKTVRHILNANLFLFILKIGKIVMPSCVKCPFHVPFGVSFYLSQFFC